LPNFDEDKSVCFNVAVQQHIDHLCKLTSQ